MKLSLLVAVVCASLASAKKSKKPKTKTTRTRFTPTFFPANFTKGWSGPDPSRISCAQCKDHCAIHPTPKWLDEWYACIKFKCSWGGHCKPTDWGVFPETTANATTNSTSLATSNANAPFKNATSATSTFITITSTTAPGPTASLSTISSTSSVAAAGSAAVASPATSSSSFTLPPLRPSFITSMEMIEDDLDD